MVKALWRALSVRRFYIGNLKREEVNQVFGLKKYLEEFTLNNEHSLAEVQLWKEYLVYASLFGNAEQVCKDMQKVFPDFEKLRHRSHVGFVGRKCLHGCRVCAHL